jgi:hypothetical protein
MALIRTADGVGAVRLINAKTKSAFRLDQNILLPHAEPNGGRCRAFRSIGHTAARKKKTPPRRGRRYGGVVWHPGVRCCCSNLARRELVPLALNLTSGDATYGDACRHNDGGHRSRRRPDGTLADIHSRSRGNRIRWLRPHGPTGTF